ncbi:MAG TPA: serine/threonine-protein kinase, partial [Thermoanaerobaculia bacterium]|nr:serine/threonine-protein kinase [Thermoanaerobaculia bacterium]
MKECSHCGRCLPDHHAVCPEDRAPLRPVFPGPPLLDGTYRLLNRLGEGGMGTVYRAHHVGLRRDVAVKILHSLGQHDLAAQARFRQEAVTLARLDHPHIVRVADFGIDEAREMPYLVMELLPGTSLSETLVRSGRLPLAQGLPILTQIAGALDALHQEAGILHRDLKPSNVLLLPSAGNEPTAKIVDFGLATLLADSERTPGLAGFDRQAGPPREPEPSPSGHPGFVGTPSFMAPELWAGQPPSVASDLWAFGVLAYLTLTGRLPFPGPGAEDCERQIERGAPAPSSLQPALEPELDAALLAPLHPVPASRPSNASQIVAAIERAARAGDRRRWRRRETPRRLALAALLGALGAAALPLLSPWVSPLENRLVDARFHF